MEHMIGKNVIIRTVTFHYTGRLESATDQWLTLQDAAWIADSGRWGKALTSGSLSEVEPYPAGPVLLGAGAVVDITEWKHELPRTTK